MNVLIAVDDTEESLDALQTAYEFFGSAGDYTVATIGSNPTRAIPPSPIGLTPGYLAVADFAERELEYAAATAETAADELPGGAETAADLGWAGVAICRIAEQRSADVIVIGSHDRSIWQRLFDPSVGRYVADNAPCPVLVVRR